MPIKYQAELQEKVLMLLQDKPMTVAELAAATERNYETVRVCINRLAQQGVLKSFTTTGNKSFQWTVDPNVSVAMDIVPRIKIGTQWYKLQLLMFASTGIAQGAIAMWPTHVARLVAIANQAKSINDDLIVKRLLDKTKADIQADYEAVKQAANLYEALLNNRSNWNVKHVKNYPNDPTWDADEVTETLKQLNISLGLNE